MKSTGQIVLLLAAAVVLVAGATFLSQYKPATPTANTPPPEGESASAPKSTGDTGDPIGIDIMNSMVQWIPPSAGEFEVGRGNFLDFYYRNNHKTAGMRVTLDNKNCKCQEVRLLALDENGLKKYERWFACAMAAQLGAAYQGAIPFACQMAEGDLAMPKLYGLDLNWQLLDAHDPEGKRVPPNGGGFIRLRFQGTKDKLGSTRLVADIGSTSEDVHSRFKKVQNIELPVGYVRPLRMKSGLVQVETMHFGDERQVDLIVYCSTRAGFDLLVRADPPDPFITWKISDLSDAELASEAAQFDHRVLSAKRVEVHIRERLNDKQRMDVGPYSRKLILAPADDPTDEIAVTLTGTLQGEFLVGSPEDRGRIDLKLFPGRTGTTKKVPIVAQEPGLALKTDAIKVFPEELQSLVQARLEQVKPPSASQVGRWTLHLDLGAGYPSGPLPENSAVYLQIADTSPPRQVRIPIKGQAYQ